MFLKNQESLYAKRGPLMLISEGKQLAVIKTNQDFSS